MKVKATKQCNRCGCVYEVNDQTFRKTVYLKKGHVAVGDPKYRVKKIKRFLLRDKVEKEEFSFKYVLKKDILQPILTCPVCGVEESPHVREAYCEGLDGVDYWEKLDEKK